MPAVAPDTWASRVALPEGAQTAPGEPIPEDSGPALAHVGPQRAPDPADALAKVNVRGEDSLWAVVPGAHRHKAISNEDFVAAAWGHHSRVWRFSATLAAAALPATAVVALVFHRTRSLFVDAGGDPTERTRPVDMLRILSAEDRVLYVALAYVVSMALVYVAYSWTGKAIRYLGGRVTRTGRAAVAGYAFLMLVFQTLMVLSPYRGVIAMLTVVNLLALVILAHTGAPGSGLWQSQLQCSLCHGVSVALLTYFLIGAFFAHDSSTLVQVAVRLFALPLLTEFALRPVRCFGRKFVLADPLNSPLLGFATYTVTCFSTTARLMSMSMNSGLGTAAVIVGVSATEVMMRLTVSHRDFLYNVFSGMGVARARELIRLPSSRLVVAELMVVDQAAELAGIIVALEIVVLFGLVELTAKGIFTAAALCVLQLAVEAVTDAFPTLVALRYASWTDLAATPGGRFDWRTAMGNRVRRNAVNAHNLFKGRLESGGRGFVRYCALLHAASAVLAIFLVLLPGEHFCSADVGGALGEQRPCDSI